MSKLDLKAIDQVTLKMKIKIQSFYGMRFISFLSLMFLALLSVAQLQSISE